MLDRFRKTYIVYATCPKCGNKVTEEIDSLPNPDIYAEYIWQSSNSEPVGFICAKCGTEFESEIIGDMAENPSTSSPVSLLE